MNSEEFLNWVKSNYPLETYMCAMLYIAVHSLTRVDDAFALLEAIEDVLHAPDVEAFEQVHRARFEAIAGHTLGAPRWSREYSIEKSLWIMPGS